MESFGYIGMAILILVENIFPPIPSELILTFGGFMTTYTNMSVVGVITAATIGSVTGAIMLYYIGLLLPRERLEQIVNGKIGKVLHLKQDNIQKAMNWFDKRGKTTVFLCRCANCKEFDFHSSGYGRDEIVGFFAAYDVWKSFMEYNTCIGWSMGRHFLDENDTDYAYIFGSYVCRFHHYCFISRNSLEV